MKNDLNLIHELNDLLFTDKDTDPISRPVLWRRFRRHGETKLRIRCSGCNPEQGYSEGQLGCPYCKGYGYLYDEEILDGYLYKQNEGKDRYNLKMENILGKSDTTSYVLITPFDKSPLIDDTIYIFKLSDDNKILVPVVYEETMKVIYARTYKASTHGKDFSVSFLGG